MGKSQNKKLKPIKKELLTANLDNSNKMDNISTVNKETSKKSTQLVSDKKQNITTKGKIKLFIFNLDLNEQNKKDKTKDNNININTGNLNILIIYFRKK
jgi:hypothetical protein